MKFETENGQEIEINGSIWGSKPPTKQESKMRFKIIWVENHFVDNWIPENFEGDRWSEEAEKLAIKEMCDSVPNGKATGGHIGCDGDCIEIEAWDIFEAKNREEAMRYIDDNYGDVEIFNCKSLDGEIEFTEEDYE
jgi:hypothetical protein